jgi:hypothetical protein
LTHWILKLGKQDFGVCFFSLSDQSQQYVSGRKINAIVGVKIDQNRLERAAPRQQRPNFVAEPKRIGEEQRTIQA